MSPHFFFVNKRICFFLIILTGLRIFLEKNIPREINTIVNEYSNQRASELKTRDPCPFGDFFLVFIFSFFIQQHKFPILGDIHGASAPVPS